MGVKSPAFSMYANDWLGSLAVATMTPEQEGAYFHLLCLSWGDPDCCLPDDDNALAALSRLGERWPIVGALVRAQFKSHPNRPGRIYNERLHKERKKQLLRSEAAKESGIRSGRKRRSNKRSANAERNTNFPSPSSSSYSDPASNSVSVSTSEKGVPSEHSSRRAASTDIRTVFDHYRKYHERAHQQPHSEMKEWRKIAARLKEGYSVEDLCIAIDGCHKSAWHCGENPEHRIYQNLELIVRDSSKVNQFMQIDQEASKPVLTQREERGARAGQSWLSRKENEGAEEPTG